MPDDSPENGSTQNGSTKKEGSEKRAARLPLHCRAQGDIAAWLAASGGSLAITTYTSGKLVLVSSLAGKLHFCTQRFVRPMGIAARGNHLALAVRQQILRFQRAPGQSRYTLQQSYDTGKVDAHDVAFGKRGIYFANTRFNAIARVSRKKNFIHCWQPPFIEGITRGDRCHLNGLGMQDDQPTMATAFCATGDQGDWRQQDRFTSGVVLDLATSEVVVRGLCMPHSPRWHDGRWWLCNSGHGLLSTFDPQTGQCETVCRLPGFTRGLCFQGHHALVGLSKIRPKHILDAPPVRKQYQAIQAGIALVDTRSGQQTGSLEFSNGGNEVYEVLFLPNVRKPTLAPPTS
jgi:uncharacterized protein (TIGR03032 family)